MDGGGENKDFVAGRAFLLVQFSLCVAGAIVVANINVCITIWAVCVAHHFHFCLSLVLAQPANEPESQQRARPECFAQFCSRCWYPVIGHVEPQVTGAELSALPRLSGVSPGFSAPVGGADRALIPVRHRRPASQGTLGP